MKWDERKEGIEGTTLKKSKRRLEEGGGTHGAPLDGERVEGRGGRDGADQEVPGAEAIRFMPGADPTGANKGEQQMKKLKSMGL